MSISQSPVLSADQSKPQVHAPVARHLLVGHPAQSDGKSVPQLLWRRLLLIGVLVALVSLLGFITSLRFSSVVQTIGTDSVPSIVAAEHIRSTLADAHTELANVFLSGEGTTGQNFKTYSQTMDHVHDVLVSAAQNITYGDDERKPILSMMSGLASYERLVGTAFASPDHSAALVQADTLIRGQIMPAADALAQANMVHLQKAYHDGEQGAHVRLYLFLMLVLVLALVLIETQYFIYRHFRRIINPAMAAGMLLLLACTLFFALSVHRITEEVRAAKEDAFDSVYALSQAQAHAYAANAHESIYLLLTDKTAQAAQTELFNADAQALFAAQTGTDAYVYPADLKTLKDMGLLGAELANITYPGEEDAAKATLDNWLTYLNIDGQIRRLESAGQHAEAVRLCLGVDANQSDWAFNRFMTALQHTIDLNQHQFDQAIQRAQKKEFWLWLMLLTIFLCPFLGSVIGLRQRMAEFRE